MSTKTSASSSSSGSYPFVHPDFYDVMLLNTAEQQSKVLMHLSDGVWGLPYFEYPEMSLDGSLIPVVCQDFKSWLGISSDQIYFTGMVELLGDKCNESKITPETLGCVKLLVVEAHGIASVDIDLPKGAAWKTADVVPELLPNPEDLITRITVRGIVNSLEKPSSFLESLSDERYRPGWFENASHFLVEWVSRDGAQIQDRVTQCHMSFTSTLLQVKTSLGRYFLKSPACGCNETAITATLAGLFPNVCPSIVGTCKELNCFVSREFNHKGPENIRDAVLALGELQLESMDHIESLVDSGCAVRSIEMLPEVSREVSQELRKLELDARWFNQVIPVIETLCAELKQFRIPMTLVHGDFSSNNIGFTERNGAEKLILFDWEYAYIGHPFFDFHRIHKRVPKNVRDEYLKLWTSFEDIGRIRRAYEIARKLGWAMKMWSMFEWSKKCNAQHPSCLAKNTLQLATNCYWQLCSLLKK